MNFFIEFTKFKSNIVKWITLLTICISMISLTGCGTLVTRNKSHSVGTEFIATQCSAQGIAIASHSLFFYPLIPVAIIDTGLSIVIDTVLLPIDLAFSGNPNFRSGNPCGIGALTP